MNFALVMLFQQNSEPKGNCDVMTCFKRTYSFLY